MNGTLRYKLGDATAPRLLDADGVRDRGIIVHICNNVGAWGAGFVLALSKKWPAPELVYRGMKERPLGSVGFVAVEHFPNGEWKLGVANLIGQDGIGFSKGKPPIRYDAVFNGLQTVAGWCEQLSETTIHMPRIGCGLAGGDWRVIEALVNVTLIDKGIDVTVYDLP